MWLKFELVFQHINHYTMQTTPDQIDLNFKVKFIEIELHST